MSVEIRTVKTAAQRRAFVKFPEKLYKHNPYYVPQFVFDEMNTLDPKKNPAKDFCKFELYLAYKDGKLAGRVAAIINFKANEQWNHNEVRFGWYNFIDDREVSKALMDKVVEFGKAYKMDSVVGPLGFTDFDPEGMLIEGFDQPNTMPMNYNSEYCQHHMDEMGFQKDADWVEYRITVPEELPEKLVRISNIVKERANVHTRQLTRKILKEEDYAHKIFKLINDTYKILYNYTILPEDLCDKYIGFYLSILDLKFISVVENEKGEVVGFGVTMPSLSNALRKSRGELFPFGWAHIAKSLYIKKEGGVELLLVGIRDDYKKRGVNSVIIADMFEKLSKMGIKWAETNAELENNTAIQAMWEEFERVQHKRRRSYIKTLE